MSPDDRDDAERDDAPGAAVPPGDGAGEEVEAPPPSTWAGRARAGAEDPGLTEEFEVPGAEPDAELEQEADPADELEAPPDEFSFDAEGEPEEAEEAEESEAEAEVEADEPDEPEGAGDDAQAPDDDPAEPAAAAVEGTIETDTLTAADREAAREAAMAGLRARTAGHPLNAGGTAPPRPSAPARPAAVAAAATDEDDEAAGQRSLWWRFVAAAFVIVASTAAATAVTVLLEFSEIAQGLGDNEAFAEIQGVLPQVDGGEPQTIMILGSDTRAEDAVNARQKGEDPGRSDTTLLLRIDPEKDSIALLSLPRDLKVNIPGYGIDRLNAAYTYGGPKLTLETVTKLLDIDVNHVVNVDFEGFYDAVNAIDCVYIDVDRHYLNSNEGLSAEELYAEIDVPAGYSRLCGYRALQYVRYRHEDNDLVRGARQQDFVREARQRVPPSKLISERNKLIDIFTKYTTSDIDEVVTVLEVLKTFFRARDARVTQVRFQGDLGGPESTYVTASNEQLKEAVAQFLGETESGSEASGEGSGSKAKPKPKPEKPEQEPEETPMIDVAAASQAIGQQFEQKKAQDFPIYYPTQGTPGTTMSDDSRAFPIEGPERKEIYRGYKFVMSFPGAAGFTEYYGVSGVDWLDPPILENPSETREIDGRQYQLYFAGERLRLVGWKTSKGAYWVNNTLSQTLSEDQMLAVARSTRKLRG